MQDRPGHHGLCGLLPSDKVIQAVSDRKNYVSLGLCEHKACTQKFNYAGIFSRSRGGTEKPACKVGSVTEDCAFPWHPAGATGLRGVFRPGRRFFWCPLSGDISGRHRSVREAMSPGSWHELLAGRRGVPTESNNGITP